MTEARRAASTGVATIESIDHEGVGVAHVDGKVTFIEGGITGERVAFARRRSRGNFDLAAVTGILAESFQRVSPRCAYFGTCGGCAMQHVEASAQVAAARADAGSGDRRRCRRGWCSQRW